MQIGFFKIGDTFDTKYKRFDSIGYTIYFKDGKVEGFYLHFTDEPGFEEKEVFSEGKIYKYVDRSPSIIFTDKIFYRGEQLKIDKNTSPQQIANMFERECDYWDDDSEIGMTLQVGDCQIEFSWLSSKRPVLIYMIIELNRKVMSGLRSDA